MSGIQQTLLGGSPSGGYQIERSLRFNSADSAYLNRTPASAGNRKTWTWSGWVKRSALSSTQSVFSGGDTSSNNDAWFRFDSGDTLNFSNLSGGSYTAQVTTSAVFRDVSAWYGIVLAVDTTQATGSNRVKIYINGVQQTVTFTTTPSQNSDMSINIAGSHTIGRLNYSAVQYLNGYLTEVNFIDGQALTPSSFGQNNAQTGVWEPIKYTGTYGTNGFYLNFSDNSGTTSTTLGKDSSGNANNWTPNNFSVTAGSGNDSLVDTPTSYGTDTGAGGEVRGNYCTWNPLDKNTNVTIANGNLDATYTGTTDIYGCFSTFSVSSGKWYAEFAATGLGGSNYPLIGIRRSNNYIASFIPETYVDLKAGTSTNRGSSGPTFTAFVDGDVLGIAFDADTGEIFFAKNGTWLNSGNPAAGTGEFFSGLTDGPFKFGIGMYSSRTAFANFGQRPFAYTAPSGFKALCTQNLPTPTIGATSTTQANDYFNVVLWTGNSSASQAVTGVGFQPDLVWAKSRPANSGQDWVDAVRGATKNIQSNTTAAETTSNTVISFQSDGFTVGDGLGYDINKSGESVVGWCWKANGAGSSNTQGSITSTVSANTTAGFSIATWTHNGSTGTVGHGLGVAPKMIIAKTRNGANDWFVYTEARGATKTLYLNLTNAEGTTSAVWNNTAPTSTVFTASTTFSTNTCVAYCFAEVAGYSAFGSYTGNGSADGPFVYMGFRPRWVMIKRSDSGTENWNMIDTARGTYNVIGPFLNANLSNAEDSYSGWDLLSNGLKLRNTGTSLNASGGTYIYAAFCESPFKFSLAR